ncbi:type II toxin-antitoxin system VapC family toxin [Mucilaginibacter sp. FT3.2]|uniref:type II toxin-antitoxin system VapC family toxin n=1 Tax=Mucilaginibacter sp. FT3.2 TaxID=2723090 RepID=UPI00161DB2E0|nr:PIN domain nuclease of toxin-antitoxin system [Mucilaginibacter sp. FT3.2]
MNYLLDTHAFLWYIDGNSALSDNAKVIIEDQSAVKFVSTASLWEISIKISLDKLRLTLDFDSLPTFMDRNDFKNIAIEFSHLQQLNQLPHFHKDPFDRLIISQAITENITIISADQHFKIYPVATIW